VGGILRPVLAFLFRSFRRIADLLLPHEERIRPTCRCIDGIDEFPAKPILENVGIFALIIVEVFAYQCRPKTQRTKAEQRRYIRFPNFDGDFLSPLVNHFGNKFLNHLPGDAVPLKLWIGSNVSNKNATFRRFIDDETDDASFVFGDHSEAVPLLKTLEKFFFRPREFKARLLNRQHLGKIPANHPSNLNLNFFPLK